MPDATPGTTPDTAPGTTLTAARGFPSPFLKWAGGKRQVLADLLPHLPERASTYYEPFIGGGAVFWELAAARRFGLAVLGDHNAELVNVYRVVRNVPLLLMAALEQMPIDEGFFLELRAAAPRGPVARAARTIYLNKTGFNGLYRVNRAGRFNVPWGKRPATARLFDAANIQACSAALQGVAVRAGDFAATLADAGAGDVVYLDPPYVPARPTSNFTSYTPAGFGLQDQERLAQLFGDLARRGVHVVASNADVPLVRKLYAGWPIHAIQVRRAINSKGSGRGPVGEVIVVGSREGSRGNP